MFVDNAIAYDAAAKRYDLVVAQGPNGSFDLALETTPATAMTIALGCNRRALPDDTLPSGETDFFAPGTLLARQGWVGDALDAQNYLCGSRLWLLDGAKGAARASTTTGPGEMTRRRAEAYAAEAFRIFKDLGMAVGITAGWARANVLLLNTVVAKTEQRVQLALT